jgi:hypothetical protein
MKSVAAWGQAAYPNVELVRFWAMLVAHTVTAHVAGRMKLGYFKRCG